MYATSEIGSSGGSTSTFSSSSSGRSTSAKSTGTISSKDSTNIKKRLAKTKKPQGFELGKLCQRGIHQCYWGCEAFFDSKRTAGDHYLCDGKMECSEKVVRLYQLANQEPPAKYVREMEGRESDDSGCFSDASNSSKGARYKEIVKGMGGHSKKKASFTADWVNSS